MLTEVVVETNHLGVIFKHKEPVDDSFRWAIVALLQRVDKGKASRACACKGMHNDEVWAGEKGCGGRRCGLT
jgi:hypothetical protein